MTLCLLANKAFGVWGGPGRWLFPYRLSPVPNMPPPSQHPAANSSPSPHRIPTPIPLPKPLSHQPRLRLGGRERLHNLRHRLLLPRPQHAALQQVPRQSDDPERRHRPLHGLPGPSGLLLPARPRHCLRQGDLQVDRQQRGLRHLPHRVLNAQRRTTRHIRQRLCL